VTKNRDLGMISFSGVSQIIDGIHLIHITMDEREKMIEQQLAGRDIYDEKIFEAMRAVDREIFVPDKIKDMAYDDTALPIGEGQTISQPYIVAYMAQVLDLKPEDKVLEIGSGSGYNAAVLSRLVSHVFSVEIVEPLAEMARKNLDIAGIPNVSIRTGNGFEGWFEKSPYDKIILTAATDLIPETLKAQLKVKGKILAPVNENYQKLVLIEKEGEDNFREHPLIPVRFVPMTGGTSEPNRWKKGNPGKDWSMDEPV
jgi:protein-L-isoaspartate(D-aspartate) O-methyltransferase